MTYKLLIVDDETPNIRLLERLFAGDYSVLTASSGKEAVTLLDQHDVAVIITDQRMPGMSGVELLKRTADRRPHMVRILLTGYTDLDALVEAVNCGLIYMYVSKPWKNEDLKLRIGRAVQHYEDNKRQHSLGAANERLTGRLREMKVGVVRALATLLKLKNEQVYAHGSRVSKLARLLGETFNLTDEALADLSVAGFLHEVGTLGGDDLLVTQLPDRTCQTLSCIPELREVADVIGYYQENFDGTGSPFGLIGDQIPLAARIIRVASEYDRMRNPFDDTVQRQHLAALDELQSQSKRLYDPQVIQAFADLTSDQLDNLQALSTRMESPELMTCAIN